jgi:hypothetical protein
MTSRPPIFSCSFSDSGTFGPPAATIVHVIVMQIGQRPGRLLGELADALDRVDLAGDFGEHGRRVAGAGTDLQHPFAALERQRLDHEGDDVGLRDRLPLGDRQRRVVIGEFAQPLGQKGFARHRAHGIEHQVRAHAARRNGVLHHLLAQPGEIGPDRRIHSAQFHSGPAFLRNRLSIC